jgi:hypothetical protein
MKLLLTRFTPLFCHFLSFHVNIFRSILFCNILYLYLHPFLLRQTMFHIYVKQLEKITTVDIVMFILTAESKVKDSEPNKNGQFANSVSS